MSKEQSTQLDADAVGLVPTLFQSITTIAPAGGAASGLLFTTFYAGGSTPLTILIAIVATALVAITIGQLSHHLPSAGGLYTYITHGMGTNLGFLAGWGLIMGYAFIPILYWGFFGLLISNEFSGAPSWLWAPIAVAAAAVIGFLAYRGVGISTKAGVILGVVEMTIFLVLAFTLIGNAGSNNTLSVFGAHVGNENGFGSVIAGMIYTVLAFIGFEAAAPIAEESKNPRRYVPIAIIGSAIGVGIFYLLVYYGATVYVGPEHMMGFSEINGGDPFRELGNQVWGGAGILVLFAVLNSVLASCNGSTLAGSRLGFSLARIGLLPRFLSRIHPQHQTPGPAIVFLTVSTLVVAIVIGFITSGPLDVFAIFGTALTVVFIPIYVITSISSGTYYWRERRSEFHWLLHVVVPVLVAVIFVPVEVASFGIDFAGLGIAPLAYPGKAGLWVALGWMLFGAGYLVYLRANNAEGVRLLGTVFHEDEDPPALPIDDAPPAPTVA
ncbi:MAG TPA: APC family permease [Solirubrobacterales bacterium]|nr:APC family permease [Solirubrobacterales bacterium]